MYTKRCKTGIGEAMKQRTYWRIVEWHNIRLSEISKHAEGYVDGDAHLVYLLSDV